MKRWLIPLIGLLVLLAYWISVKPVSAVPGYAEDLCMTDFSRSLMSEQIQAHGKPAFVTDRVMTPAGDSVPYMSWTPERDWLGSKFWSWNPEFPFSWVFTGFSWLVTYFGVGFILLRMGRVLRFGPWTAWGVALAISVFHIPRHFKMWHHWEHLNQHWLTLSFFLDAWIWMRLQRERVWDWQLELWRCFLMVGMIQAVGTFWGPLLLEWAVVHASMLVLWRLRSKQGRATSVAPFRSAHWTTVIPVAVGAALLLMDLRWYLPLLAEVKKAGPVEQKIAWFAHISFFVRPLWLEPILHALHGPALRPIDTPETVVTVGWFYWIPAIAACFAVRRKKGGKGFETVVPFALLLWVAVMYATINEPTHFFQRAIQHLIPFMSYFRVSSRWGLFLPQILAIVTVLGWPELAEFFRQRRRSTGWQMGAIFFCCLSLVEMSWLSRPVNQSPAMTSDLRGMLEDIRKAPGDSVLSLPYCVTGGNGVCGEEQCSFYPASTLQQCLSIWHRKKIYGLYEGRMSGQDCAIYHRAPYDSWFTAWRENRCFNDADWKGFCSYLDLHLELSAVLWMPGIWTGAGSPECRKSFIEHLGAPLETATAMAEAARNPVGAHPTEVFRFGTKCVTR